MSHIPNTLETLIAKEEIRDVLSRYARGIDRGDRDLLKSAYHLDAIEEHLSVHVGPAHEYIDGAIQRVLARDKPMAHYLGTSYIEIEGDVAFVETYALAYQRKEKDGEPWDILTGERILDRFEKRDGVWKIAHRKFIFDWNRDMRGNEGGSLGSLKLDDPRMLKGRTGPGDPSYTRF